MKKLAILYAGASYQHRAIHEPKYARHFAQSIYILDLPSTDLSQFEAVLVPSRIHEQLLMNAKGQFEEYLQAGGTVIAFGEQPKAYLPGVTWEFRPTNFWWWLDPQAPSGLVLARPDHSLFNYITLADATWHQHGVFWPADDAEVLIATEDGGAILYVDRVSSNGTLVVTSLDPIFHFGSHFMPATERFLDGFLPWVTEKLL